MKSTHREHRSRHWSRIGGITGSLMGLALMSTTVSHAQDVQVKSRVVVRDQNGERVIEVGGDQLPVFGSGGGGNVIIMSAGSDGKVVTFAGTPDAFFMDGNAGALMGGKGSMIGSFQAIDPGRSYIHSLIQREDVKAHLYLTAVQKDALEKAQKEQVEQIRQQVIPGILPTDVNGKSPEEIGQMMKDRVQKMQEQVQALANEREKKLATILKPEQIARLKELDLQWRGPLAMGTKEVAEQAKLSPEHATQIEALLKEYRLEVMKKFNSGMMIPRNLTSQSGVGGNRASVSISGQGTGTASASASGFAGGSAGGSAGGFASGQAGGSSTNGGGSQSRSNAERSSGGKTESSTSSSGSSSVTITGTGNGTTITRSSQNGQNGNFVLNGIGMSAASQEELQQKREQMRKEVEKLRKTQGDKALRLLSSEEQARWKALTGKPFIFRSDSLF